MSYSLFLFDDEVSRSWDPFVLTRPAGELQFGAFLLRERSERYWGESCQGHLASEGLAGFSEPGSPGVYLLPHPLNIACRPHARAGVVL